MGLLNLVDDEFIVIDGNIVCAVAPDLHLECMTAGRKPGLDAAECHRKFVGGPDQSGPIAVDSAAGGKSPDWSPARGGACDEGRIGRPVRNDCHVDTSAGGGHSQ